MSYHQDTLYYDQIELSIARMHRELATMSRNEFNQDPWMPDAVRHQLTVMGRAALRCTTAPALITEWPWVNWVVDVLAPIDPDTLWQWAATATTQWPAIRRKHPPAFVPMPAVRSSPALDLQPEVVATLCRSYPVVELRVFGSVLREDFTDKSDIDVLGRWKAGATGAEREALREALAVLWGRSVDLSDWEVIGATATLSTVWDTAYPLYHFHIDEDSMPPPSCV